MSTDASGTPRGEWQCAVHCHSVSNVPNRCARGRVAVSTDAADAFKPEWQCASHCHSTVNVPNRHAQGRVAVRRTLPLGIERAESARPGASGSVD